MGLHPTTSIRLLGAILVLGIALALNIHWLRQGALGMGGDEFEYDLLARRIIAAQGFTFDNGNPTAYRTPGFPLILAGIYLFSDGDIPLTRAILVILTSLTAVVIYSICLLLMDDTVLALLGGLGWSGMAMTIQMSGLLYGESSAALIFSTAILFSILSKKYNSNVCAGLAGLLMGLAIITRGHLLFVTLGSFIWLLLWKKRLAFVYVVFAAIMPVLWMSRNAVALHSFTLSTQTPRELWSGNNAWTRGAWAGYDWLSDNPQQLQYMHSKYPDFGSLSEVEQSRRYNKEFINEVTNHPMRISWLIPRKVFIYLSPSSYLGYDWIYAGLLPFSFIGLICLWRNKESRHWLWLIGFPILGVMMICILTFGDARFRHPINAMFATLAAIGLRNSFRYTYSGFHLLKRCRK